MMKRFETQSVHYLASDEFLKKLQEEGWFYSHRHCLDADILVYKRKLPEDTKDN
jgi:hypothetical protein